MGIYGFRVFNSSGWFGKSTMKEYHAKTQAAAHKKAYFAASKKYGDVFTITSTSFNPKTGKHCTKDKF